LNIAELSEFLHGLSNVSTIPSLLDILNVQVKLSLSTLLVLLSLQEETAFFSPSTTRQNGKSSFSCTEIFALEILKHPTGNALAISQFAVHVAPSGVSVPSQSSYH